MAKLSLVKASTAKIVTVFIQDSSSTSGAGLTGLVFNSAGLSAYYYREGAASAVAITLATMTLGTWATGGFVVVDGANLPGVYTLGIPDAALASGANSVTVMLKGATNMAPLLLEIQLTDVNFHDAVRGGMTALPNAAAEAAGGLYTRGAGAGQINQAANGMIDTNPVRLNNVAQSLLDLKDFADDGYDPATNKVQGVVLTDTVTTYTGNTPQTGDAFARLGAPAGASISADVAAVQADTDNIQTRLPAALVSGRMDASVGAMAANTLTAAALATDAREEIADQVWDELLAGHAGVGSAGAALSAAGSAGDPWVTPLPGAYGAGTAGNILGTNLDAVVSSRASAAALSTVQADTDNIQSRLPAGLVSGRMDASVGAMAANVITATAIATDAIDNDAIAPNAVTEIQAGLATAASITALNNISPAQVNAEVLDVLGVDTQTEIASIPPSATTLISMLKTIFAFATNPVRETAATQTLRNRADSANIGTATVSDDNIVAVRGGYS